MDVKKKHNVHVNQVHELTRAPDPYVRAKTDLAIALGGLAVDD